MREWNSASQQESLGAPISTLGDEKMSGCFLVVWEIDTRRTRRARSTIVVDEKLWEVVVMPSKGR
jgi:hypothetical protein